MTFWGAAPSARNDNAGETFIMETVFFHSAVIVIGFLNLMFAVVEFMRPDWWENIWRAWISNRLFRLHGLGLILTAAIFVGALPTPNLQWFIWLAIFVLAVMGATILADPGRFAGPILAFYLDRPPAEAHRFTYMDAAFRVIIGLCMIISITG